MNIVQHSLIFQFSSAASCHLHVRNVKMAVRSSSKNGNTMFKLKNVDLYFSFIYLCIANVSTYFDILTINQKTKVSCCKNTNLWSGLSQSLYRNLLFDFCLVCRSVLPDSPL